MPDDPTATLIPFCAAMQARRGMAHDLPVPFGIPTAWTGGMAAFLAFAA